ncbi:SCO family protein, partial [Hydrogenophaga borbori]
DRAATWLRFQRERVPKWPRFGNESTEYTAAFDPSFLALRGDLAATDAVAKEFKIHYSKVPTGSSYTMDHTALTYVIDAQGRLRLGVRHEQGAQEVADDLRQLMDDKR